MYQILGLAFDGCQASGLVSPFDVFNVTNTLWKQQRGDDSPLYRCSLVSVNGESVRCSSCIQMLVDYRLEDAPKADLIIIPGIHHYDCPTLIKQLNRLGKECYWLQQQTRQGVSVSANCSGVFLLAETGALAEQRATTAWWLGGLFQQRYPNVQLLPDQLLVKNSTTYCTGSMTANLGVMLQIIEQQVGRQLAQNCARTMLLDASQSYASPYLFVQQQTDHQDSLVLAVESWLQRNVAQRLNMEQLASLHSVSTRTLSRRFKQANGVSLSDYLQQLRLGQTQLLLENTSLSIEQIVERVGYSSQSSLRRLFQKQLGLSPRQYRQQNQQPSLPQAQS
ncbi:MAG: helix-turn-helix domain-containing protein [Motiliproteus sp.]